MFTHLIKGRWKVYWWTPSAQFGFHHTYLDSFHYTLNLKLFSIGVVYCCGDCNDSLLDKHHLYNIFFGSLAISKDAKEVPFGFGYTRYDGLEMYSLNLKLFTISVLDPYTTKWLKENK